MSPNVSRAAVGGLFLLAAGSASALTVSVTNNNDSGPGSLRAAVLAVNAGSDVMNQIVFSEDYPQGATIHLQSALPAINRLDVMIDGNGRRPTIRPDSPGNRFTLFVAGPDLLGLGLRGLRLHSGRASLPTANGGGCVHGSDPALQATLELIDVEFDSCLAEQAGVAHGGAVYWRGRQVTVQDSRFYANQAVSSDGTNASGGGIYAEATVVVADSIFVENSASGQRATGGAVTGLGEGYFTRVQFTYNRAIPDGTPTSFALGGALMFDCFTTCFLGLQQGYFGFNGDDDMTEGGAVFARGNSEDLHVTMENTTFYRNAAAAGGAVSVLGVVLEPWHVTMAGNTGTPAHLHATSSRVWSRNSVFTSEPTAGCYVADSTGAGTFAGDASCATGLAGATLVPGLAPSGHVFELPMSYVTFAPDSIVVDNATLSNCAGIDALGQPRPLDGNDDGIAQCDAGAYEHLGSALFSDGFEQ